MGPFIFLIILGAVNTVPLEQQIPTQCGYENCPTAAPDLLNVHIVPHTHDDVGWLKTVDQYYYGSRNNIQKAGVQYIIDSVVKELWEDPKRRFIYVETAFFWKWWVQQPQDVQNKVRRLVKEGRLQFVGGAWSMNDEAAAHYQSVIDQFTWGLSKINKTFGSCALPRVGWQIDPFGHSREFASLLAGMGYDGLFLGRIDYQDKANRLRKKLMEMIWRGDDDLGSSSDIFTGVLYNTYSPPPGFCFDVLCNDEPIIDDPDSPMFNVDSKVDAFIAIARNMSRAYRTNNILVTMGEDFNYQHADMWFKNLDLLIQYANLKAAKDGLDIKLFYSTPNCYLKAVNEANPTLPSKSDDFFPYASDPNAYWTGYFTSRPTTKFFERQGNTYLQVAKQLQILGNLQAHNEFMLNELRSAMGVMQHHDAITGTEKRHVASDYVRLLNVAIDDSLLIPRQTFNERMIEGLLHSYYNSSTQFISYLHSVPVNEIVNRITESSKILQGDITKPALFSFDRCRLNESSCHASENNKQFVVTLYNPLGWHVNESVRIPVTEGSYDVYAPNGDKIDSQIVEIPSIIQNLPTRRSKANHEVVFIAYLKPLMFKSFYIQRQSNKQKRDIGRTLDDYDKQNQEIYDLHDYGMNDKGKDDDVINIVNNVDNKPFVKIPLTNGRLENLFKERLTFNNGYPEFNDEEARMLGDEPVVVQKLEDFFLMENDNIKLHIDNTSGAVKSVSFPKSRTNLTISFYYYPGCIGDNETPNQRSSGAYIFRPNATKATPVQKQDFKLISGKVVKEARVKWSDNVYSSLRLYQNFDYLELDWIIGPINIDDKIGKEFIVKYETDMVNNGEFYTDSNGRQMLKRKLNYRPQYNVTLEEPVAGNYYPVTNEIYIENDENRFTVLTDRSEGGTSLSEGEVELMLHRRLLHDDAFGVGEALNETEDGQGLIVRGTHRIMLSPVKDSKINEQKNVYKLHLQPLVFVSDAKHVSLDEWMKLKNCYNWLVNDMPDGLHLLTIEPWDGKMLLRIENYLKKDGGSIVEVDLAKTFRHITPKSITETNLSAVKVGNNLEWKKEHNHEEVVLDNGFTVKIKPKQIRTFIIAYDFVE